MLLIAIAIFILMIVSFIGLGIISKKINNKTTEISETTNELNVEIAKIDEDKTKIENKKKEYTTMIERLREINNTQSENKRYKNAIPTLLNQIMYVVPKNVQITSIENTTGTKVTIVAKAEQYEQLGYFKGKLKTDNILTNIVSDGGQKQNNTVTVTIKGDLP